MSRVSWYYASTCLLLAATWAFATFEERGAASPLARPLGSIPTRIGDWISTDDPPLPTRIAQSLAASETLLRTYRKGDKQLSLFIAYYANQLAGDSMHSPKHCLPGGGWEPLAYREVPLTVGERRVKLNNYVISKDGERQIVLYWYQSPERIIANEYAGKAYLIWDALIHHRRSGSIVRLALDPQIVPLGDALAFAAKLIPKVDRCFGN